jgi:hypothetical protein
VLREVDSPPVDLAWAVLRSPDGSFMAFLSTVDANTGDPVYRPAVAPRSDYVETVLQGLAKVSGAAGTNWSSSLVLVNTLGGRPTTRFSCLVRGQENPTPEDQLVQLEPYETRVIDDVVAELFGLQTGAISVATYGHGGVLLSARTFNQTEDGTYGQFIPAQMLSDAITTARPGVFVGVVQNEKFRSNLGLTNPNSITAEVSLTLVDRDGVRVGAPHDMSLGPGEVTQLDRVTQLFGAATIDGATLKVELTQGSSIVAFVSIIDRRTGDPVFQTPTME